MFKLHSDYDAAGDQPEAIEKLTNSIASGKRYQTLLGVTGSGKTFTMASVIERLQMPTLIMTHNKTLAAQLYHEFKSFFPSNNVEYFISYYDYYQPEAYLPRQDLFIEKDSAINDELERLRLSATASLMGADDVIVVASVSANYGLGNPEEYKQMVSRVRIGQEANRREWLLELVEMGYRRNDAYFDRGCLRVQGESVDIFPTYLEAEAIRVEFFGDETERIRYFNPYTGEMGESVDRIDIFAASAFAVTADRLKTAIATIETELESRLIELDGAGKAVERQRLKQRVEFDLEMLKATGGCKGIENYSRHFTLKQAGEAPYTMMDYFAIKGKPYLVIVDESHVSLPQFRGMFAGDRSRKEVLVEYGFRLPSALDNRPLKFDEFIEKAPCYLFVSATPAAWEMEHSATIAEQVVRPTGLLDPAVELSDSDNQAATLYDEAKKAIARGERILVTTLTKKMAEELQKRYLELGLRARYLHSDIDAIERNEIIRSFRAGEFDMLIGINLLREGLDLPEVSLVAIFDADKEGFLRSETALIQTMGRAARNLNGKALMFCKKESEAMKAAIATTKTRREKQIAFNEAHGITPRGVARKLDETLRLEDRQKLLDLKKERLMKMPSSEKQKLVKELSKKMQAAAKLLEFEEAARLRDEIAKIRAL
ncbi:MAG: excinuclease ABC subunit UvrB [Helicobacteraceae bacterium]|jgi:excinuclease ABC subunit B|nr:excinuclease ABC subunit UvrB [Helicobacteraceae bacterium]